MAAGGGCLAPQASRCVQCPTVGQSRQVAIIGSRLVLYLVHFQLFLDLRVSWSYCGVDRGQVPDSRPLGFPFDRCEGQKVLGSFLLLMILLFTGPPPPPDSKILLACTPTSPPPQSLSIEGSCKEGEDQGHHQEGILPLNFPPPSLLKHRVLKTREMQLRSL